MATRTKNSRVIPPMGFASYPLGGGSEDHGSTTLPPEDHEEGGCDPYDYNRDSKDPRDRYTC